MSEIFHRPGFDFVLCTERPGTVRSDLGLELPVAHGLDRIEQADLVLSLPGTEFRADPSSTVLGAFRAAHRRGAIIAAHCVGTFLPAAAGLLDGLAATTHWRFAADLAARHPAIRVSPDSLYVDEGRIVTGAGAVAGIDLCLYLIRREHGAARANAIARELVTTPYRNGGQQQFLPAPIPEDGDDDRLAEVVAWARGHLDHNLSVDHLATRALMSRRSFTRRFKAATGTTPHAWLLAQRLNLAEELLETTDLPIEHIAHRVGYRSGAVFREQFTLRRGVPPRDYRKSFRRTP